MAHDIANINGQDSAYFADEGAWHNLGTVVTGARSSSEVIALANMNWEVEKQPLFDQRGNRLDCWGTFRDGEVFFSPVGKDYTITQNREAFSYTDALISADTGAFYESAGALGKGERIWLLARIPHDFEVVSGDKHITRLLFTTSHDGSVANTWKLTETRVVCANTLNMALKGAGCFARIKHTRNSDQRLQIALQAMQGTVAGVKELEERLRTLAGRIVNRESYMSIMDKLFPPSMDTSGNQKSSTRRDNTLLEIARLFEDNDKNAFPEVRGTAYNVLNSITAYVDHSRAVRITDPDCVIDTSDMRRPEMVLAARKESALFGTGSALKSRALDVILDVTKDCATKELSTFHSIPSMDTATPPKPVQGTVIPKRPTLPPKAPKATAPPPPTPVTQPTPSLPIPLAPRMQKLIATFQLSGFTHSIFARENDSRDGLYILHVGPTGNVAGTLAYVTPLEALDAAKRKWGTYPAFTDCLDSSTWVAVN